MTLGFALLLLANVSCSPRRPSPHGPRLVVLYAPCTVSKKQLSPYTPGIDFTPNLERFARESLVFRRHTTEAEQSGPAFASIVTGSQVDRHGVLRHPQVLSADLYLVSEAFRDAGYETWFWDGHPMAAYELEYGQGFDDGHVTKTRIATRGTMTSREAESLTANDERFGALIEHLRANPEAHAFVQVSFTVSHGPYTSYSTRAEIRSFRDRHDRSVSKPDDAELERWLSLYEQDNFALVWDYENTARRLGLTPEDRSRLAHAVELAYETAIERLDTLFGRFLDRIRAASLFDESVVAFTADHGEVLHRDNVLFPWTHGFQLAPESTDVPWILHAPSVGAKPGRYENVTRSIDVFPTLAGLCDVPIPSSAHVDGVDLSAAIAGRVPAPELDGWSHSTVLAPAQVRQLEKLDRMRMLIPRSDPQLMWTRLRTGDVVAKLCNLDGKHWTVQVFDLAADPEERRDLFDATNPEHARKAEMLAAYKERLIAGAERVRSSGESRPKDELERLKGLGYVK